MFSLNNSALHLIALHQNLWPTSAVASALPYRWTQTLQDVTVSIPVRPGSKSRDLIVEIKQKRVKVAVKADGPDGVLLDGELPHEVKVDDSTWTLGQRNRVPSVFCRP